MALSLNTNMMALNASRNLNSHYNNLATSVRRLSSGLRVTTAADDAAGLAIRELMRADIATLNQGIRNANDAISMIQTMDGALGVIDEKLIRMKELAEQAATGTYNSDQRLIIDSEFQAMASEITRIALATDFNGIKLLCNDTANKLLLTAGGPVEAGGAPEITGQAGEILNPDVITADAQISYYESAWTINSVTGDQAFYGWRSPGLTAYPPLANALLGLPIGLTYSASTQKWSLDAESADALTARGFSNNGTLPGPAISPTFNSSTIFAIQGYLDNWWDIIWRAQTPGSTLTSDTHVSITYNHVMATEIDSGGEYPDMAYMGNDLWDLDGDGAADIKTAYNTNGGSFGLRASGSGAAGGAAEYVTKIHFGTGNDSAEDYYYIKSVDCTAKGLGLDGTRVQTQQKAQESLGEIDGAIIKKDNARAYLGSMQNRLENTISNLAIQSENIQAAESRISDVDVATEMTELVRNQVLASAATAMLAQANSLPQMALSLMQ